MTFPRPADLAAPPGGISRRTDLIRPWHRERLAIVYVRQSTPQQVLDHQESARLQYGLTRAAETLGWTVPHILVIDDDTGHSGASAHGRLGFQRLVSEVSLDHVGIILGVEMSRLARSNADWHQLLELCALFRTLIADLDGIYDPAQYNDRLLLGLKGAMSEAELHILKQRMHLGKLSKAQRGALRFPLPIGYVWDADGAIQFDPDEQVRGVVHLIFRTFDTVGTVGGVVRYLARHQVQIGIRVREGAGKGSLVWRRPNDATIRSLLKHPLYAGVYVFGRRQQDARRARPGHPGSGRVAMPRGAWHADLPDHVPAYISWARYEANQARIAANRARMEARGAVRGGAALLAGLVVCARCRVRLSVRYCGDHGHYRYVCAQWRHRYAAPCCQSIAGPLLDAYVSDRVLEALAPAALALSLQAADRVEEERAALHHLWQQRRERAAHAADRAARQFQACEPEHRLVARSLERAWDERLREQQEVEEAFRRFCQEQPRTLSARERLAIEQLATDIPALWSAASTTPADRKEILRQVVERVTVQTRDATERVEVSIDWAGGGQSVGSLLRPVARLRDLSTYGALCERVAGLTRAGLAAPAIAACLNEEGFRHIHAAARFTDEGVRDLQRVLGLRSGQPFVRPTVPLGPDEWWPGDLRRLLGVPDSTLYRWMQRGTVRARKDPRTGRWIVLASAEDIARLRVRHCEGKAGAMRAYWSAGIPTAPPPPAPDDAPHQEGTAHDSPE